MPLTQAIFDHASQAYVERPFRFKPSPVQPGPELDADIATYLRCYGRTNVMPTAPSLLFMGRAAKNLFLRRNQTRENWDAFIAEVCRRYPALRAHDEEVRARVSALAASGRSGAMRLWRPTMPEVCVGLALLELKPAGVTVIADAPLPGGRGALGHVRRCDYHVASRRGEARVEVAGLINRNGAPPTPHSVHYAQTRMPARDRAYSALGLAPPITVYADEILDRSRLLPLIADVMHRLS